MAFIGNLAEFIVFILFFRLIYLLFKCIKTKDWSVFKKNGIIFLICFIITGIFTDNSSNEKNTTSKSNKTEKVSKKSSKSSLVKSSKISHNNSSKNYKSSSSLSIINEISTENNINNQYNNNDTTTNDDGLDHTAQQGKIIGNIRTHIYHTNDEHDYKISPKNEIVFSNEQDAINAGYRKAFR